eukprot:gene17162-12277_t
MKILTLGDGNLSFSLALSRRLRDSSVESLNDWSVTATTFDTTEKLLEKYPESNHVLQEMASARLRDHRGFVLTDKLTVNEAHWPGYDFRRHQTGKSFRQRVGSCFHYSFRLAHSMNKEHQSTIANLLRLLSDQVTMATSTTSPTVAVPDATADGTVGKATSKQQLHQEQKTKQRKMHQLVEGRFRIVTAAAEDAAEAAASPTCTAASSTLFECLTCHKRFPAEQGVRTHVYTMHVLVEQQLQQEQQRADASSATGPHADTATEPPKKRLLLRDAALAVDTGLQPPSTHATDTAACAPLLAASSSSVAVWRCLDCDRSFSNQEALLQHRLAKHVALSTALSQLPSSSSSSSVIAGTATAAAAQSTATVAQSTAAVSAAAETCAVCGWAFTDAHDKDEHQALFAPRDLQFTIACDLCHRSFASERSIAQHRRMCLLLHRPVVT